MLRLAAAALLASGASAFTLVSITPDAAPIAATVTFTVQLEGVTNAVLVGNGGLTATAARLRWPEPWRCAGCSRTQALEGWPRPGEAPEDGRVTATISRDTTPETAPTEVSVRAQWNGNSLGWVTVADAVCAPASACTIGYDVKSTASSAPNMNGAYQVMHGTALKTMKPYAEQDPKNEYFDVYSPQIKTLYGQVFWTMMEGTPLPPAIVERFKNKTMAVVGYECNQVGEDADGNEYPIPINAAYNHHHGATLQSKNAVLKRVPAPPDYPGHVDSDGMIWVSEDQRPLHERTGIASTTFHEGNGGEFRSKPHEHSLSSPPDKMDAP